ncbi:MAG: hypothetical protein R2708_13660 [Vicinamibacterales bacterium]
MHYRFAIGDRVRTVTLRRAGDGWQATVGDAGIAVDGQPPTPRHRCRRRRPHAVRCW